MARPLRIAYRHAFYQVTCRGNGRRSFYKDDQDRSLFLDKLKTSLEIYGVKLHAYVLMSNHLMLRRRRPICPNLCATLISPTFPRKREPSSRAEQPGCPPARA